MKVDGPFYARLSEAPAEARRLQSLGYDGIYTLEGAHDPFFPLLLAAEHCPGLDLATAIAVALPRNPAHVAAQAWDLQSYSRGHFMLGLGSQVRAHIENRFGMPFRPVAARMREYILAVRAFFDCWQQGVPLRFEGRYYRHTLMTPMFNPGPNPFGPPPILLGALGPRMTAVAGEVADGLIVHPFNNQDFLRNSQLPIVHSALQRAGRSRADFTIQIAAMCVTGATEQEYAHAEQAVRNLLAFYASTPAYRPALEAIGWEALQPELNRLSKQGRWEEMGALVEDDLLHQFAVCGEPGQIADQLWARYGDLADRLGIYAPYPCADEVWSEVIAGLQQQAA